MKKNKWGFLALAVCIVLPALSKAEVLTPEAKATQMKLVTEMAAKRYLPGFNVQWKFFPFVPMLELPAEWKVGENIFLENPEGKINFQRADFAKASLIKSGSFKWRGGKITVHVGEVYLVGMIEGQRAYVKPVVRAQIPVAPVYGIDRSAGKMTVIPEGSIFRNGAWEMPSRFFTDYNASGTRSVYFTNGQVYKYLDHAVKEKLRNYRFYEVCKRELRRVFPNTNLLDLAYNETTATMVTAYEDYVAALQEVKTGKVTPRSPRVPARTRMAVSLRYWNESLKELFSEKTPAKSVRLGKKYRGMAGGVLLSALVVGGLELLNHVLAELEEASARDADFSAAVLAQDMRVRREIMKHLPEDPVLGLLLPEAEQRALLERTDEQTSRDFAAFLFDYVGFALATQEQGSAERDALLKVQQQKVVTEELVASLS